MDKAQRFGCAVSLIGFNALIMGLLVSSFGQGPYSSWEQEVWYRYGSIGILLVGTVLPAVVMKLFAQRSPGIVIALICWMLAALCVCFAYAFMSGGGV